MKGRAVITGLDMYLRAKKYVSGYDFRPLDEQNTYEDLLSVAGIEKNDLPDETTPSGFISLNVAYWRKANAIHGWFVSECQDGVDNCQNAYVSRQKLEELLDLCKQVDDDHDLAPDLLPPAEGFFFGTYEYDEWYFADITNTIKMLTKLLANPKFADWDFEYQSSW